MSVREELRKTIGQENLTDDNNNSMSDQTNDNQVKPDEEKDKELEEDDDDDEEDEDEEEEEDEDQEAEDEDEDLGIETIQQPPLYPQPLNLLPANTTATTSGGARKSKRESQLKKKTAGRTKAQRKRGIYVDDQGNATIEKSTDKKGLWRRSNNNV